MATWQTHEVYLLSPSLVPTFADEAEERPEWGTVRPLHIMPWDPHVVAEGIVDPEDFNLRRALREEGVEA